MNNKYIFTGPLEIKPEEMAPLLLSTAENLKNDSIFVISFSQDSLVLGVNQSIEDLVENWDSRDGLVFTRRITGGAAYAHKSGGTMCIAFFNENKNEIGPGYLTRNGQKVVDYLRFIGADVSLAMGFYSLNDNGTVKRKSGFYIINENKETIGTMAGVIVPPSNQTGPSTNISQTCLRLKEMTRTEAELVVGSMKSYDGLDVGIYMQKTASLERMDIHFSIDEVVLSFQEFLSKGGNQLINCPETTKVLETEKYKTPLWKEGGLRLGLCGYNKGRDAGVFKEFKELY